MLFMVHRSYRRNVFARVFFRILSTKLIRQINILYKMWKRSLPFRSYRILDPIHIQHWRVYTIR